MRAVSIDVTDDPTLVREMALAGCSGVFVGFESLADENLADAGKKTPRTADYARRVALLHDHGIQVNGSFVLGFDHDRRDVFARTVGWIEDVRLECATFHILTPYPGTALHQRMQDAGRITTENWDLYDTRHVVYRPARIAPNALEEGYWRAYRDFYRWGSILRSASTKASMWGQLRHVAYAGGWKKFEPLWDFVIRAHRAGAMLPVLETILSEFGRRSSPMAHRPSNDDHSTRICRA